MTTDELIAAIETIPAGILETEATAEIIEILQIRGDLEAADSRRLSDGTLNFKPDSLQPVDGQKCSVTIVSDRSSIRRVVIDY